MGSQKYDYKHINIGLDQSYSRCGISIVVDGIPRRVSSTSYPGCVTNSEKRVYLSALVSTILEKNLAKAKLVTITVERIRTFTGTKQQQGDSGFGGFRPKYLVSTGALIGCVVDTATKHGVKVYSTTTLSWKTQVLGTAKVNPKYVGKYEKPEKALSIIYAIRAGFDVAIYDSKGNPKIHQKGKLAGLPYYDDDAADALGIGMAIFNPACRKNMIVEE